MGCDQSKGFAFVGNATAQWRQTVIARERFLNEVRAITGWNEVLANRLDRRLGKLAQKSLAASHDDYRREWRRRYSAGWKYAKWPRAMMRFVK